MENQTFLFIIQRITKYYIQIWFFQNKTFCGHSYSRGNHLKSEFVYNVCSFSHFKTCIWYSPHLCTLKVFLANSVSAIFCDISSQRIWFSCFVYIYVHYLYDKINIRYAFIGTFVVYQCILVFAQQNEANPLCNFSLSMILLIICDCGKNWTVKNSCIF